MAQIRLFWQSKLVLLLVLPLAASGVVLQAHWWAENWWPVALWALGLSLLLGVAVVELGSATPRAAFTGAVITASLIFSTATFTPAGAFSYTPWHTALVPVLAVVVLTFIATRLGRKSKELRGLAEQRQGRTAAQVAANLGIAALASSDLVQSWLINVGWVRATVQTPQVLLTLGVAALAEAAADTVSSEVGQVLGGQPRMITTLQPVEPGTDGAVSIVGTLAGVASAAIVATAGSWALGGGQTMFMVGCASGIFGLFFDSLLGATLERRGWLNNDAVNFLSTASASAFALGMLAFLP